MKPTEKQKTLIDEIIRYLEYDLKGTNDINSPSHFSIQDDFLFYLEDKYFINEYTHVALNEALGYILTAIRKAK
jgi:hypothetical protein